LGNTGGQADGFNHTRPAVPPGQGDAHLSLRDYRIPRAAPDAPVVWASTEGEVLADMEKRGRPAMRVRVLLGCAVVAFAMLAIGPGASAAPEPTTNCLLSVPWFVDTAGAAQGIPAADNETTTVVYLHNSTGRDLAAAIGYSTSTGVFIGPRWPDNYFLIPAQSTVAFRPVADDPASVRGGQETDLALLVPNRPMGADGGNDNKRNGSLVVRWYGNPSDVQGILKEWRQSDDDSVYSNAVLLPPGTEFVYAVPEMVSVPAGTFTMGNRGDGDDLAHGFGDELPRHDVTLSAYQIGKYEVTNQQVCDVFNWANSQGQFAEVNANTAEAFDQELLDMNGPGCEISYSGETFVVESRDTVPMADHPVVAISWYGAAAYCNWLSQIVGLTPVYETSTWTADFANDGYHLPTEAQWERAAAWDPVTPGGPKHWIYGFIGDTLTGKNRCNHQQERGNFVNPLGLTTDPYTSPVGWFDGVNVSPNGGIATQDSPSPVGCYDMSGNVSEWCHDQHEHSYYSRGGPPWEDPTGPGSGGFRVLRGGSWGAYFDYCRSADRGGGNRHHASSWTGFRVARRP